MRVNLTPSTSAAGTRLPVFVKGRDLDFEAAKSIARQKAMEFCRDPMLLSWCNGQTGAYYPNLECGTGGRPAWIVFAESRGGDLTIDINDGQYIFIYLRLD